MREIGTIFAGIGLLIFTYLVLTQAPGFGIVASSASSFFTNSVSVLQGQGTSNLTNPAQGFGGLFH